MHSFGVAGVDGSTGVVGQTGVAGQSAGQTYYFSSDTPDVVGYESLLRVPSFNSEDDDIVSADSGTGEVEFDSYITIPLDPGTNKILAGAWHFYMYHYVSSAVGITQFVYRVFKRTTGDIETELFNVTSEEVNALAVIEYMTIYVQVSDITLDATDRLVVKVFGKTTSVSSHTLHFVYEGSVHASHIHTTIDVEGVAGPRGASGIQGDVGQTGIGETGPVGNTGVGTQGATGLQGPVGNTGASIQGATGIGTQGETGPVGSTGASIVGATGVGTQGETGIGTQGATGVAGSDGMTGVAGDVGQTGVAGDVGQTGVAGDVGQTGVGVQGATGASIVGATGASIVGATGPVGATGVSYNTDFEVLSLPGVVLWLDVGQLTGYSDGDDVNTWTDYSGFGRDGALGNAAKYYANIVNGHPILSFNGTSDYYDLSAGIYFTTAGGGYGRAQGTIIFVLKHNNVADARVLEYCSAADGVYIRLEQDPTSTGQGAYVEGGLVDFNASTATSDTSWEVFYMSFVDAQYGNFWINRTLISQANLDAMTNVATDGIRIGRGRGANVDYFKGWIAEVIWCRVALSSSDRIAVTSYLMDKYAIT